MSVWAIVGMVLVGLIVLVVVLMILLELPDLFKYLKLLGMSDGNQPQAQAGKSKASRN